MFLDDKNLHQSCAKLLHDCLKEQYVNTKKKNKQTNKSQPNEQNKSVFVCVFVFMKCFRIVVCLGGEGSQVPFLACIDLVGGVDGVKIVP